MTFFEILKEVAFVITLVVVSGVLLAYAFVRECAFFDTHEKIDNINDWIEEQKKKNGEMEE